MIAIVPEDKFATLRIQTNEFNAYRCQNNEITACRISLRVMEYHFCTSSGSKFLDFASLTKNFRSVLNELVKYLFGYHNGGYEKERSHLRVLRIFLPLGSIQGTMIEVL
jgi:hypothetical protein